MKKLNNVILIIVLPFLSCQYSEEMGNKESMIKDSLLFHIEYYKDSTIKYKYQMKSGIKEGQFEKYSEKGILTEKGRFKQGEKSGLWINYSNDNGKIENVNFYSKGNLLYSNLDVSDYSLENFSFKHKKEYVRVLLPENWEKQTDISGLVLACKKQCFDTAIDYCPNVTIVEDTSKKLSYEFKDYVNESLVDLQELFDVVKIVSMTQNFQGKKQSILVSGVLSDETNQLKLGIVIGFVKVNSSIFIINCTATNNPEGVFLKYQDLFIDIVNSFEIIN